MALYDKIGGNYDKSRLADPYISGRLYAHLRPDPGLKYLDLACGTGNYTIALNRLGMPLYGIDNSPLMIDIARQKDSSVKWLPGNAEALPFPDSVFSGITCILAIHHFTDLNRAFAEAARVLSKGCFVIFTATSEQMRKYWLNHYFPQAMKKSIEQMPGKSEIESALKGAGFKTIDFELYEIRDDLEDLFLYSGKNQPELYLQDNIRRNISTFAAIASPAEVKKGCTSLEADIRSGRIKQVIESYLSQDIGDYAFVIAHR